MTTLVMNTIINPFRGFGKGFMTFVEITSYARAASELARCGYYEEAKSCMMQVKSLKNAKKI